MSAHNWPAKIFLGFLILALTACSAATPTPTSTFGRFRGTRTFNPQLTETPTETPTSTLTPTITLTPTPTSTITPFPTITEPPVPCNLAAFGGNVTIPDGMQVHPNYAFTKEWQLRNIGSCTWTTGYAVVFVGGDRMGDVTAVSMPGTVHPGYTITVSVPMVAPAVGGTYTSYWMIRSDSNVTFGVGLTADQPFWAQIVVLIPRTPGPTRPPRVFHTPTPTP